jgi:hypothetical protein
MSPPVASLLQGVDGFQPIHDLLQKFSKMPKPEEIVYGLIANDLLVIEGIALDIKDRLVARSWKWKQDIRYYHYSSQYVRYEGDVRKLKSMLSKLAREVPPQSSFKDYKPPGIKLDGTYSQKAATSDFWQALLNRRTKRDFLRKRMSFHDFSILTLWTWGKTHTIKSDIGESILKTSPSAGSSPSNRGIPRCSTRSGA